MAYTNVVLGPIHEQKFVENCMYTQRAWKVLQIDPYKKREKEMKSRKGERMKEKHILMKMMLRTAQGFKDSRIQGYSK